MIFGRFVRGYLRPCSQVSPPVLAGIPARARRYPRPRSQACPLLTCAYVMILKRISILNYKNLEQVELAFSPKLNCFFGQNGMGKTNLLDAVYYLSFCKSAGNPIDSQNILHEADFFMIQGFYEAADGTPEEIYCGMKRRQKKQFKRNKKEYTRLSDHIGFVPLVMVSPADSELIAGGSEGRRRFMDVVISQYDKEYLNALIRYNKALTQRNVLLKSEQSVEEELFLVWEEMMAQSGEVVYRKREAFIREFIPIFQYFYSFISQDRETSRTPRGGLCWRHYARAASATASWGIPSAASTRTS